MHGYSVYHVRIELGFFSPQGSYPDIEHKVCFIKDIYSELRMRLVIQNETLGEGSE